MDNFSIRRSFGKGVKYVENFNLIGIQRASYLAFLQNNIPTNERKDEGLQAILKEILNLKDPNAKNHVEFIDYELSEPEFTEEECVKKGKTYSSALKVKLRLIRFNGKGSEKVVKEITEKEIFFADIPVMCKNGGYVINGVYRVIVSQLHKSSGVFFDSESLKDQVVKKLFMAHVIPFRGSWLDFEADHKGILWVRIDKKRKILLSTFLMLIGLQETEKGLSKKEILDIFYETITYTKSKFGWVFDVNENYLKDVRFLYNLLDAKTGEIIVPAGKAITKKKISEIMETGKICIAEDSIIGMYLSESIKIGELEFSNATEIDEENLKYFKELKEIKILNIDNQKTGSSLRDTIALDKNNTIEDALLTFYKIMRPGEIASIEGAIIMFKSMFFDHNRYDLSMVGRVKLNSRLKKFYRTEHVSESRVLEKEDYIAIVKGLIATKEGNCAPDDVDHLACRRVRSVGELVANQVRIAMYKIAKSLKERLSMIESEDDVDLLYLVNTKVLGATLREFFGTSQLSQMMDNLNPLAKLAHDRRITAMGRGGVTSSKAVDTMRDVGESYYGRICCVETPEGQNIGLISYLSVHAKIDQYGFIQTPYQKVVDGVVTDKVVYLDAQEEENYNIASYCVNLDKDNRILDKKVACRKSADYTSVDPKDVEYIDVSSSQILSVAASLIPFVANNDPGRALMGSNMQRQALPLKYATAPYVGTGLERQVGVDSMSCIIAKNEGRVVQCDSAKIVVQDLNALYKVDIYSLKKFERSNAYSCINHRPLVKYGEIVKAGQIIADGSSTQNGEISLGRNLRVAFMLYKGYTFEDAIVISSKLLNDSLTSVRVEELSVSIREGEDIVKHIPGVSEQFLKNLDEAGIVYVGAKIKPGDVLVGRVAPKAESIVTPEERLLKAMFGEKASNYMDVSLRVPPGCTGTVIDVQISHKKGATKEQRENLIENVEIKKLERTKILEISNLQNNYNDVFKSLLRGQKTKEDNSLPQGITLDDKIFNSMKFEDFLNIQVEDDEQNEKLLDLAADYRANKKIIIDRFERSVKKAQAGDILPTGITKIVKVFVAMNRVIEPGDKLAGRHGNKGVISKILPVEDMPFDNNGYPVDIILNPLGIAARMNIGQVLETHLGWVSNEVGKQVSFLLGEIYNSFKNLEDLRALLQKIYPRDDISKFKDEELIDVALNIKDGVNFAIPSFDGPQISEIKSLLEEWNLSGSGKIMLRDGMTGEYFDMPITVGYMYIMKLNHMIADKVHARSTGSYSLVNQQPLSGRSKMGGQRKGEMEVWALQAYGAAYITKESMTIKSDDHVGRLAAYEAIIKGQEVSIDGGSPEGFKVLLQELRSIMLNLEFLSKKEDENGVKFIPSYSSSNFDALKISLMSPEKVKELSFGEIKKSETINYRTQRAEIGGLLCPQVFGCEKDYTCACGRYSKMKYRGITCEKCHVEVSVSRVRRERMGHIELATPVAHVWFTRVLPSSIGLILDLTNKVLDKILRFESYIIIDSGITLLEKGDLLTEEAFVEAKKEYGADAFRAVIGAEGIEEMLKAIDLEKEKVHLKSLLNDNPTETARKKLIKRLKMVDGFIENNSRPEWMIIRYLPVMPADLRPLVALDAGRFATVDLNDLYRKVINRNNRLKQLEELGFPDVVIRNEKRMLAASVNAVIDNSRIDQPFVASNGRPLQSIADSLKGKQGRFRQNLLGKRVDYSGRSVIVVGPNLKLHECGLPKKMALELFKPHVYSRLEQYGYAATLKSAKKIVEEQRPEVWEILKEVTYQHPVLLNRAPTLHRLGIQAFECVLVDSNAIQLHPLVCTAFNADFDGDQMSVHIPLSVEAQIEARVLMMPSNNMISPANGDPITVPKKDMVLGLYHLTNMLEGVKGEGLSLNESDIKKLLYENKIHLNASINVFVNCPKVGMHFVKTTPGRLILFHSLPENHEIAFESCNKLITGKESLKLFELVYQTCKRKDSVEFADVLMRLGFEYATYSGVSVGIQDMIEIKNKEKIVEETKEKVAECERQFAEGLITEGELKNQITDAWFACEEAVGKEMEKELSKKVPGQYLNALYMMYHSGARGSTAQMRYVLSMRGVIAKISGEFAEQAIVRSYKEGMDSLSYFTATHGARKGFSDMALKTADAGYFTRKLVDVAQDCIITSKDCYNEIFETFDNKERYINFEPEINNGKFDYKGIFGRILAEDIQNPEKNEILFEKGHILSKKDLEVLESFEVLSVKIRSPITCANEFGICAKCYGVDLSKGKLVNIGEPVGVVAAQSIGEPGAQLTMRTFHTAGGAKLSLSESSIKAISDGYIKFRNAKIIEKEDKSCIMLSRYSEFVIVDSLGRERGQSRIPYAAKVFVKDGDFVKINQLICEWDPNIIPRLAEVNGYVEYVDLIEGVSLRRILDESTGTTVRIVNEWKKSNKKGGNIPSLIFKNEKGEQILADDGFPIVYKLESEDMVMVDDKALVNIGDLLIKKQKVSSKSGDITAGLPRLIELFEVRQPKLQAIICEKDGIVSFGKDNRFKRCVIITSNDGEKREYMVSKDINILVQAGDPIRKGDPISEGSLSLHDILRTMGTQALVSHLLSSIKSIFNSQGMFVDNKHIECIIRYMTRKVEIIDHKNSSFVNGEQVDYIDFINEIKKCNGEYPVAVSMLQGITKAASMDRSYLKSASFQEPHKALIKACFFNSIDHLRGMKEALITGKFIPAGTGFVVSEWEKQYKAMHN